MRNAHDRYFSAYQAYRRAKNPQWKDYWRSLMLHFEQELDFEVFKALALSSNA